MGLRVGHSRQQREALVTTPAEPKTYSKLKQASGKSRNLSDPNVLTKEIIQAPKRIKLSLVSLPPSGNYEDSDCG